MTSPEKTRRTARFDHEWLPDRITIEMNGVAPDTVRALEATGHAGEDPDTPRSDIRARDHRP